MYLSGRESQVQLGERIHLIDAMTCVLQVVQNESSAVQINLAKSHAVHRDRRRFRVRMQKEQLATDRFKVYNSLEGELIIRRTLVAVER